jgi:hypothetical protein
MNCIDTPININNNDNAENDELRKQKVDFSKFNSPPLNIFWFKNKFVNDNAKIR